MALTSDTTGLFLYTSNRMEALAQQLAKVMLTRTSIQCLEGDLVVVQTPGIARWLSMSLADNSGCCLNVHYLYPRNFVEEMLKRLTPTSASGSATYDPDAFTWAIYGHLPEFSSKTECAESLRLYLQDESNLKRLQLAERLARLFDNYAVYRPDFIANWSTRPEPGNWQAELWRYLRDRAPQALPYTLAEQVQDSKDWDSSQLPETIYLFALSTLPPAYIDFLGLIAAKCSIHIFHIEPAESYWGDIQSRKSRVMEALKGVDEADLPFEGNPLLGSMGKQGRDFTNLLIDASVNPVWESFSPNEDRTLLAQIQNDILELNDRSCGDDPLHFEESDKSITIANCPGPTRELEALKDYLLDAFDTDKTLRPRDILVLTPDIEALSPYIESVFGAHDGGDYLPYGIADRGPTESPVFEAFLQILKLPGGRVTSRELLSVIERPVIRERFTLSEGDLDYLRGLVKELNIRWGLDKNHRAELGFYPTDQNAWLEGLHRLALGAAMFGTDDVLYEGMLLHNGVEGEKIGIVERFIELASLLMEFARTGSTPAPISEWHDRLLQLINAVIVETEETRRDLEQLRKALIGLKDFSSSLPDPEEPLDIAALKHFLGSLLINRRPPGGFLSGGITFAELKLMRSVPARIVCLVGMNDEVFPRREQTLPFDLMTVERRMGDRSQRDGDRYLFLETLLSARDRLYLSYSGMNLKGSGESPPSVLVSELLDYIRRSSPADINVVDKIVVHHWLHAFNPEYFNSASRYQSYSISNAAAAQALLSPREQSRFASEMLPPLSTEERTITLDDLIKFFSDPAKYFLERRLGMRFLGEYGPLKEDEPDEIDGLTAYSLKDGALKRLLHKPDVPLAPELDVASGALPWGIAGRVSWTEQASHSKSFYERLRGVTQGRKSEALSVALTIPAPDDGPGYKVHCNFPTVFGSRNVIWSVAKIKEKYRLNAWISHLAASVAREEGQSAPERTTLVCEDETVQLVPVSEARALFTELIHLYHHGMQAPLPFFPRCAYAYATSSDGKDSKEKMKKALGEWNPNSYSNQKGEGESPYVKIAFRCENPLIDRQLEFTKLAIQVWGPYLSCVDKDAK